MKFDSSLWTENFATKFDLVCDKSDLKAIPYYGWFIGMLLTTFTLQLPDFFGRWKVMFFSQGCISQGFYFFKVNLFWFPLKILYKFDNTSYCYVQLYLCIFGYAYVPWFFCAHGLQCDVHLLHWSSNNWTKIKTRVIIGCNDRFRRYDLLVNWVPFS